MKNYAIVEWKGKSLRKKSEPIKDFSEATKISEVLSEFILDGGITSLAAPQIAVNKQIFVARIKGKLKTFVNPKIINKKGHRPSLEYCISLPMMLFPKIRPWKIKIAYQDLEGNTRVETYKGRNAVRLQHEADHLEGKLLYHFFNS